MNLWAETQFNPQQFPWLFVFLRSHSCIWSKFWFDLSGLAMYPFPVIYMDHAEFPLVGHLLSVLLGSLNTIWECDGRVITPCQCGCTSPEANGGGSGLAYLLTLPSCPGQDKETSTPGTSQLWGSAHGWCFCLLTSVGESISAANSQVAELVCIWLLGQPIDFPSQGRVGGFGNSIPGIQGRAIIIIIITVLWTDRISGTQIAFSLILCPSSLKAA